MKPSPDRGASRGDGLGPKIIDGALLYESPSGIKTFGDCARKWYARYVLGIREPETKAQRTGTDSHGRIEHYLKTGEKVLTSPEEAGRVWIPPPQDPSYVIEPRIDLTNPITTIAGVPIIGKLDLMMPRGPYINPEGETEPAEYPEVKDWKTGGDPVKYGLSPSAIREDFAMNAYAHWTRRYLRQPTVRVRLSHVYFSTRKRLAFKRTAVSAPSDTAGCFERTAPTIRSIVEAARAASINDLPASPEACDKYNGCPYRGNVCVRSPDELMRSLFPEYSTPETKLKEKPMSEENDLLALLGGAPTTPAAPPAASPVDDLAARQAALEAMLPPAAPPAKHEAHGLLEQIAVFGIGTPPLGSPLAKESHGFDGLAGAGTLGAIEPVRTIEKLRELYALLKNRVAKNAPAGVVAEPSPLSPPDAPTVTQSQAADPVDVAATLSLTPAVAAQVAAVTPPPAEEKPKKTRGRPSDGKCKLKLADARARVDELEAQIAASDGSASPLVGVSQVEYDALAAKVADYEARLRGISTSPGTAPSGLELWVDAYPLNGDAPVSLDSYVDNIISQIAKAGGVPHVLLAESDSKIAYGRWRGFAAQYARSNPPAPGRYVLLNTRGSQEREAIVEALRPLATVHRGVS